MTSSTGPTGAAPPPPGEKPNFDSPRDVGHFAHTLYMCFIEVIVVFFFAVRVCVKLSVNGKFRLEDWSCLIGWVFIIILHTTIFMKLHYGLGYHIWEITDVNFEHLQKWMYAGSLLYSPAAFFTKTSILLLTVRVFSIDKTVARTLHLLLAFILICYIPAEVAKAAVCIPVQSFWDLSIVEHKCIDQTKLFLYDSSLSVFSDLFILIVPIVLTSRMKVPLLKKIKIVGLLGTGGVGVAVTVYRIYLAAKYDKSTDPTMDFVPLDWTVTGELAIGIACACIPSIHHVWEQHAARAVPSSGSRELLTWWREASKRYYDALSSWGRAHVCRMPTFRRRKARSIDSVAVLDATPDSENGEPKKLDYDVELAALSASHPGPHPGELVHPGVEGHGQNWLIPLPVNNQAKQSLQTQSPTMRPTILPFVPAQERSSLHGFQSNQLPAQPKTPRNDYSGLIQKDWSHPSSGTLDRKLQIDRQSRTYLTSDVALPAAPSRPVDAGGQDEARQRGWLRNAIVDATD